MSMVVAPSKQRFSYCYQFLTKLNVLANAGVATICVITYALKKLLHFALDTY